MDEIFYDPELEENALACVLVDGYTWHEMHVKPIDFYNVNHAHIAEAIDNLSQGKFEIDVRTIAEELKRLGHLENIGGGARLTQISARHYQASGDARYFGERLRDLRQRRELKKMFEKGATLLHDLEKPISIQVSDVRQIFEDALNNATPETGRSIFDVVMEVSDTIESRMGKEFTLLGTSTGYQDIDHKLDGLQDGWMYLIAARPGKGKTAMLTNLAVNTAKQNKRVLFFSVEMSDARIVQRMISAESNIKANILKHGAMETEDELTKYYKSLETIGNLPVITYAMEQCRSIEQIESITRKMHALGKVDIIFVDYLQLLDTEDGQRNINREQEVSKIARRLKRLTGLNIPVVAAAQLNREADNTKPTLANLRESGSLEQEADAVCFLYHPNDEPETSLEFIVAKNRDGALGECPLYYDKTTQKIQTSVKSTIKLN